MVKKSSSTIKSSFPPLLHLSYVLQQLSDELLEKEVGIGLSAARIMSALSKSAPSSQRVVASVLSQTEANVSRQLQNMKKQGLVSIHKSKKDSRQREVTLTSKGVQKQQAAIKILKKQQRQVLNMLSSGEMAALEQAAQKLSV